MSVDGVGIFKELNVYVKKVSSPVKVALVYPSTYQASITNLFTHIAYYYLNSYEDLLADRFTIDNPTSSCTHSLSLRRFDIALFSLSYEFDYINALKIITDNNIPIFNHSSRRPILVAGGPTVTSNPLPLSKFFDVVVIGEGEEALKKLASSINLLPSRRGFLETLASNGFYIPSLHDGSRINKMYVSDLDTSYYPEYQIQSLIEEPVFGRGFIMEISRGCPYLCTFCMESVASYPYRTRGYSKIIDIVSRGVENNKLSRVIFYSLSFFSHPASDRILETLIERGLEFSIPSVRADTLDESRLSLIRRGGQKTLTLAPETHSRRLKCLIRKYIDDELLTKLVVDGIKLGMDVKMYYLIGIPFETVDDVNEMISFLKNLARTLSNHSLRRRIRVTLNPLIPKAGTPMQFLGLTSREDYQRKVRLIKSELPGKYFTVEALSHNLAYVQALLSLGGAELGDVLIKYVVSGYNLSDFRTLLTSLRVDPDYVFRRRSDLDILPWDFINLGVDVNQMYRAMMRCVDQV